MKGKTSRCSRIRRPKWRWCRRKVATLFSTRLIPYLSRTTSETKGQRPETTGNSIRRSAFLFRLRRWSQTRPGPRSQGGDTGSNPVGTTSENGQVKGLLGALSGNVGGAHMTPMRTRQLRATIRSRIDSFPA
jgi:hypothetical protein